MINNKFAPIAIFAYRRKALLEQVIIALKENIYASESDVFFFLDGARNETDLNGVEQVRAYVRTVDGFNSVTIVERDKNYGLAQNIISGVTEVVNRYGKIIVLEDDIITGKYFLEYMNNALDLYEKENSVMEISGYSYPHGNEGLPETALLHFTDCWGWATWKRAWDFFEKNPKDLIDTFSENDIYKFNIDGSYPFWNQVLKNNSNQLNTWAIFWQASVFKKNGLMLYPTKTLVENIGFDGSGENCGSTNVWKTEIMDKAVTEFPMEIKENKAVRKVLAKYLSSI